MKRFSLQSFDKSMKQENPEGKTTGSSGSHWVCALAPDFLFYSLMVASVLTTVVISVNCYLPLAPEYLQGIQFHCIFANKYQMTVRKTAVFSCIYPLISRAE